MEEKKCAKCGKPIDETNDCSCEPTVCCNCCSCGDDCTCGCRDKAKAEQPESPAE